MTDFQAAATTPASVPTATARKALVALSSVIDERDRLITSATQANVDRDAAKAALIAAQTQMTTLTASVATLNDQVQMVGAANASLVSQRDDALHQQVVLTAQVATLTTQLTQAGADQATLQAQVAALQAELAAQQPHTPPATVRSSIVIGASTADARTGRLPFERTYAASAIGRAPAVPVAHSFKGWDVGALTAWLKTAPAGCTLTYFHEPEDNIDAGRLKPADWTARWKVLCQTIIDTGRVGEIRPTMIFMGWSAIARTDMLKQLIDDELVALMKQAKGILGWDTYLQVDIDDPKARPGSAVYAAGQAYATGLGLPWGIFETGVRMTPTVDKDKVTAWWTATFAWLGQTDNPPTHFLLWNPATRCKDDATGEVFTYDFQQIPAVVALWRQAMTTFNPPTLRPMIAESLAGNRIGDDTSADGRSDRRWWQL